MSTTASTRARVRELEDDLLEREAERKRARRFFWVWIVVSLLVMIVGNGLVPWTAFLDSRVVLTVTVVIPPVLALMSSLALMVLSRVGVESKLATRATTALWVCAVILTFEGMHYLKLFALGGEVTHPATWTAWLFPLTVDLPIAVGVSCVYALRPARTADIRAAKRALVDELTANPTPRTVRSEPANPTPQTSDSEPRTESANPEPRPQTSDREPRPQTSDREPRTTSANPEPRTDNGPVPSSRTEFADPSVVARADRLVGRTTVDRERIVTILTMTDEGHGPNHIARVTGVPRGRVMRIREHDSGSAVSRGSALHAV
ncbi:hypothetical protein P5W04_10345 [Mycobacteroides abscessus subsp. abscessus]|uniref:hypothetical protein n=1 Tax=Mycobacteroides abscessus TaxID=36809 RepID=UPI000E6A15DF|nr:hypothetical protein [Mycobacteroides abscessus]MBN7484544.1 hypothetical protein [Mycobacteroides abscessus subsp. abscessus]MDO3240514.1 hypothetical protein [Mycobacteroides abscessus subsp. abscessus]RIT75009.1 hypothetical protein D2E77_01620 [Mycobacteroides abscessus]